jgi:hypothetical protein
MNWLKSLFKTNYITKHGFLQTEGSSRLESATLYIYNNGLCVVEWCCVIFSVTRLSDVEYALDGCNSYGFVKFLAIE